MQDVVADSSAVAVATHSVHLLHSCVTLVKTVQRIAGT